MNERQKKRLRILYNVKFRASYVFSPESKILSSKKNYLISPSKTLTPTFTNTLL